MHDVVLANQQMIKKERKRLRIAAFTFNDVADIANWRDILHWPISPTKLASIGEQVPQATLSAVATLSDPLIRQVAVTAAGVFGNSFMSLLEAAWLCAEAARTGIGIRGGPPEMDFLATGTSEIRPLEFRGPFTVLPTRHPVLRGFARTLTWTPPWRFPLAIVAPSAVAVSHNALLRRAARRHRISFRNASDLVCAARDKFGAQEVTPSLSRELTWMSHRILDSLLSLVSDVDEVYRDRLRVAFVARTSKALMRIVQDINALRDFTLPNRVWSGTHGAYATRAIAAEIMRRGGEVDSFDHGGDTAISQLAGSTALIELCTTKRFHVATPEWADLLKRTSAHQIAAPINDARVVGESGEPLFERGFSDLIRSAPGRRRIIYVGHPFRGIRQVPLAAVPDSVYWDFQIHIVEILLKLNIDLLCKPHPEGHFVGTRNPIEELAPTSYRRFEEHIDDADTFLFDAPTSTTFFEAMLTRRPVVLLDRFYKFSPAVFPEVQRRVRIVQVRTDEFGRLRVAEEELTQAIMDSPYEADPSFFRKLCARTKNGPARNTAEL